MKQICLMILIGSSVAAHALAASQVKFYRWNPGFRAESVAALETEANETEFKSMLQNPENFLATRPATLFHGCYLVEKSGARVIASAGKPSQSELYRICLNN